ncbi:MAG: tetratricopeptide repeat protein [Bacteroidetes bacterium]|nr:tetratricopeptide repeat protein [Bacteroidota bacterium]
MGNKSPKFIPVFLLFIALLIGSCNENNKGNRKLSGADSLRMAREELTRKIGKDETNPTLFNLRAKVYLLEHEFDNAIKDINKAISLDQKKPVYYITLSDIYLLMGKPGNCGEALQKALNIDPDNKEALLKEAKLNLVIKDYPQTFEYTKRLLQSDKATPEGYLIRGVALLETGDTARAVQDFQTVLNQYQQNFEALMELGELYSIKKDKIAIDYLKSALNIRPKSKEALYMLGMFYQENNQPDKAIQTYLVLEKADSTFRNAPYNIGYIYLVMVKDFSKAIQFFSDAIRIDPAYAEAWYNRGLAYEHSNNLEKAYNDYQKTLQVKTNYTKAIEGLNRLDKAGFRK